MGLIEVLAKAFVTTLERAMEPHVHTCPEGTKEPVAYDIIGVGFCNPPPFAPVGSHTLRPCPRCGNCTVCS